MGEFIVSALFWQKVLQTAPRVDPVLKTPVSGEILHKNSRHLPVPRSLGMRNREFYRKWARKKEKGMRNKESFGSLTFAQGKQEKGAGTTFIIAPHPDDEILCCARAIFSKVRKGESVKIIFLTDGDAYDSEIPELSRSYGARRQQESRVVARRLGLSEENLFFLGFPDKYLNELKENQFFRSKFTTRSQSSSKSTFPRTPYTRANLRKNIARLFQKFPPAEVFLPSSEEEHPDHRVAGEVVKEALAANLFSGGGQPSSSVSRQEQGDILSKKKLVLSAAAGQPKFAGSSLFSPQISEYIVHGRKFTSQKKVDTWKLGLIRVFRSQFHGQKYRDYLVLLIKPFMFGSISTQRIKIGRAHV